MRIPFDSLTLAAVVAELQGFVGGKVQRITQTSEHEVVLWLYSQGHEGMLLISCHPLFSRIHFVTKRPPNLAEPPVFCATLRSRLDGARINFVKQIAFDRLLDIEFESGAGLHWLKIELMGKHSNIVLVDSDGRSVTSAKWINKLKSSRPIQPGMKYSPPPFPALPPIYEAGDGDDTKLFNGGSPFLLKLLAAMGPESHESVKRAVETDAYSPVISPQNGAYPISIAPLDLPEFPRATISIALEQHFDQAIPAHEAEALRSTMITQLERILLSREVALSDLREARGAADRAGQVQLMGELILAYGATLKEGASLLEAQDYEGKPLTIPIDPEKTFLENANTYFDKAKRAKARKGVVLDQIERLSADKAGVEATLAKVRLATRLNDLKELQDAAKEKRWLHFQALPTKRKEDRPYEGHRVRELHGPGGFSILYGENAEANDYLTLRVAKPNDLWLHIRGSTSAHVVIVTHNQPEKVGRETLMYAAQVAVQNSPSKHAGYVPVDYTLRKYVRKPRSAPKGTALYTHEKTLHIEGK